MEIILNHWRGTGTIFSISIFNITGTMIYALYLGLLFGLLTTWYIGALTSIGFSIVGKWETQEVYYGFIHFVCNAYIILKVFYGI